MKLPVCSEAGSRNSSFILFDHENLTSIHAVLLFKSTSEVVRHKLSTVRAHCTCLGSITDSSRSRGTQMAFAAGYPPSKMTQSPSKRTEGTRNSVSTP